MPRAVYNANVGYQLKSLNHRHEAVLTWLLCNPNKTLKECADALGYTPQSIYNIVGSDLFQQQYRRACAAFDVPMVVDVRQKLLGLGQAVIDSLTEDVVHNRIEAKPKVEVARLVLEALGYVGNDSHEPQRHLHLHVEAQKLLEARELAARTALAKNE